VTNAGAVVGPGTSPEQINIRIGNPGTLGQYEQLAGGALNIEIAGTTPGTEFDQIVMDGEATLGGTLDVSFASSFVPAVGAKFRIVSAAQRNQQFQTFNFPSEVANLRLNYLPTGVEVEVLSVAPVFEVTSAADSRLGSLRQAILDANACTAPRCRIEFNIAGGGPFTITLLSPLPTITHPVVIDGATQPGFAGIPLIELDGLRSSAAGNSSGLVLETSNSVIRALTINDFPTSGIELRGTGGHVVEGCFVGTDLSGTVDRPNNTGILVVSDGNRVGGPGPGQGNLISGNISGGVTLTGVSVENQIVGNLIGVDVTGSAPLGNAFGIHSLGSDRNLIGGVSPGAANVIAFNTTGVFVDGGIRNTIRGNSIFGNTGLGIDNSPPGVSENDPQDVDATGNLGQNFPIVDNSERWDQSNV
jgi:hypothetical protein